VTGTFARDGFAPMHAMLSAVRGGARALAERPLAIFDCCPTAPLAWSDLGCRTLLDCARARVPATLLSTPLAGATAPVTLRDAIVQHAAENLAGLVLHQLAQPGAPLLWGGCPAAFDMRTGTTPVSAVESMLLALGHVEVGRHLRPPTHAYLALSDAKSPDYQAGFETGMGAALAALAGVDLASGAGLLDFVSCQSLEKLVLDHDVCAAALRLARGLERREEGAAGLIAELVAAREMLSHPHTRRNWRQELSLPSPLVDRGTYADWERSGAASAEERAPAEVARRLAAARSEPLPAEVAAALDEIMSAEARRHGLSALPGVGG
jgi:trimethylamine--corrinoid protein Co-methyltransferase